MSTLRSFCLALALALGLSACQAPPEPSLGGGLSFAAAFPVAGFRTQALPAQTRAIAVAVFSAEGPGGLEAGLVLTPALPSRRVGLLVPGPRKLVALAFDAEARPLAGARGEALIEAGKTSRAELDLQPDFRPSSEEIALLRALLYRPQPGPTPQFTPFPSPTPTGNGQSSGTSTPAESAVPEPEPSPAATASPSPVPSPSPSKNSGGGGGGGSSRPDDNSPDSTGGDLGADVSLEPGDENLPPISATSAP